MYSFFTIFVKGGGLHLVLLVHLTWTLNLIRTLCKITIVSNEIKKFNTQHSTIDALISYLFVLIGQEHSVRWDSLHLHSGLCIFQSLEKGKHFGYKPKEVKNKSTIFSCGVFGFCWICWSFNYSVNNSFM